MIKAKITSVTESLNSREKAVNLANMVSEELKNVIEVSVSPYEKFENSWRIEILFELTDSSNYIERILEITSKIAIPWTVWYTPNRANINLVFNKTDYSRVYRKEYNVIRWASFDLME